MKVEGVGPITASAIVATVGDAMVFKNGRQMSAWLGLTPRQHSSGNTTRLCGISNAWRWLCPKIISAWCKVSCAKL